MKEKNRPAKRDLVQESISDSAGLELNEIAAEATVNSPPAKTVLDEEAGLPKKSPRRGEAGRSKRSKIRKRN